jgi:manganese/zinc/iron transport system substrate-binding protein
MFTCRFLLAALAAATLALGGAVARADTLKVVATTGMIADAARVIGGDAVEVTALMGPGVDPHAYRQTRSDIQKMVRADLVLWHGLFLEAQMEGFFDDLSRRMKVVAVAEATPEDLLLGHDRYTGRYDPHVWMAPAIWKHSVTEVARALSEAQPKSADVFSANADAYLERIENLDTYAAQNLSSVPEGKRFLITAHDAFKYFGAAYDIEVLGIQGISTESEAGLSRIRTLVDTIVDRRIGAVFVESSVSDRNVRALIEGAAARGHEVIIGGELFSDAMGQSGTYEGTYLGMIDHNVTTIARALGGAAPERGLSGHLGAGG